MSDAIIFEKNRPGSLTLPVMSLREVVMFPKSIVPLFVGRDSSIKAIERALDTYDKRIFLVAQKDPSQERPEVDGLFDVGTVSKVLQMLRLPDGTIKVLFEGLYRSSWDKTYGLLVQDEIQMVRVSALPDTDGNPVEGEALVRATHEAIEEYAQVNRKLAKETVLAITSVSQPGRLADSIAPHLKATYDRKQGVLELRDPVRRLERVYELIQEEVEVFSLEKKIKGRVKKQMEENQKDYYLGEQLKAIHKEMGRDFDPKADVDDLENQLRTKDMPEDARTKGMAELKKLRQTRRPRPSTRSCATTWTGSSRCPGTCSATWPSTSSRPRRPSTTTTTAWRSPRSASSNTWPCRPW
jgi:ATP-dependent Lon protease